ncbi:hypothetical protein ACWGDT_15860 [Streptomyces avermitilis]
MTPQTGHLATDKVENYVTKRMGNCAIVHSCEWCQAAQSAFDNLLDIADGLWRRYQSPEQHSFTANGRNLHRAVSRTIRARTGSLTCAAVIPVACPAPTICT